jgi:hypothetical protein
MSGYVTGKPGNQFVLGIIEVWGENRLSFAKVMFLYDMTNVGIASCANSA